MQLRERERSGPTRCPYCHDGVVPGEGAWPCPVCATVHHQECAGANKGCTLPGCTGVFVPPPVPVAPATRPGRLALAVALGLLVFALALAGALGHAPRPTRRAVAPPPPAAQPSVAQPPTAPPGTLELGEVWRIAPPDEATPALAAATFSGDRAVLVRGSALETFDSTGRLAWTTALPGTVTVARFTPDGRTLAFATREGQLYRLAVGEGRAVGLPTLVGTSRIESLAISADGRRALTAAPYGPIELWELETGARLRALKDDAVHSPRVVRALALSDDGRLALTIGVFDEAVLWNAETGDWIRHEGTYRCVAFVPGTSSYLLAGGPAPARVDAAGARIALPLSTDAARVAVTADGRRALVVRREDRAIVELDVGGSPERPALLPLPGAVGARSPGAQTVLALEGRRALVGDGAAVVVDLARGRPSVGLVDRPDAVTALAIGPGGGIVVGRADGRVERRARSGEPLDHPPLPRHGTRVEALVASGEQLTSASADARVRVCAGEKGTVTRSFELSGPPRALAIDPVAPGRILIGDANGVVRLVESGTDPGRIVWRGSRGIVTVLALGGDRGASLDEDGAVHVWSFGDARGRAVGHGRAIAAWRGELLVAGLDEGLHVVRNGSTRALAFGNGAVTAIGVHPGGRYVATASLDGRVRLHDLEMSTVREKDLASHVTALVFEAERLYAGTATGEVYVIATPVR